MRIIDNVKPKAFAKRTGAQLNNQGITYNEAGKTYNEAGLAYGGVYGQQDSQLSITVVKTEKPISFALPTEAQLSNPGITYNEAGVSYNDSRYVYGGLYGAQNVFPLISLVYLEKPRIVNFGDIYTPGGTTPVSQNIPLGPGWFLFITQ